MKVLWVMVKCPKCGKDFEGNVCPYCGYNITTQPAFVPPIETPQPSYQPQPQNICLLCGGSLTFVKEYAQWYCPRCGKYASEMPQYPCPTCGRPLVFIQQYQRWYCRYCNRYA